MHHMRSVAGLLQQPMLIHGSAPGTLPSDSGGHDVMQINPYIRTIRGVTLQLNNALRFLHDNTYILS